MSRIDDPLWWTAVQTAAAIRSREISPNELADLYIGRSREVAMICAVVTLCEEDVIASAKNLQRSLDKGCKLEPLAGVPFTVKDLIATAGTRTMAGSKLLLNNVPKYDAPAVARLRRHGALLLAKTACPELGFGITTESQVHGTTLNPWSFEHSPGGSSGGESALIAAGGSPLGLGTDYGGSLRWPACSTGIFALRPTPGRIPNGGQVPGLGGNTGVTAPIASDPLSLQGLLQVIGPLARSTDDLELALSLMSGYDEGDLTCTGPAYRRSSGLLDRSVVVGYCFGDGETPVDDEIITLIESIARCMGRDGYRVVCRQDALSGGHSCYNDLRDYDRLLSARTLVDDRMDEVGSELRAALDRPYQTHRYSEATARERALSWRREFLESLQDVPVLLSPVAPCAAVRHGGCTKVGAQQLSTWELMAFCRAVSLTGAPSVSVPCMHSRSGLPLGVQVITPPLREDLAFGVARYLEATFGGAVRLPEDRLSGQLSPSTLTNFNPEVRHD